MAGRHTFDLLEVCFAEVIKGIAEGSQVLLALTEKNDKLTVGEHGTGRGIFQNV